MSYANQAALAWEKIRREAAQVATDPPVRTFDRIKEKIGPAIENVAEEVREAVESAMESVESMREEPDHDGNGHGPHSAATAPHHTMEAVGYKIELEGHFLGTHLNRYSFVYADTEPISDTLEEITHGSAVVSVPAGGNPIAFGYHDLVKITIEKVGEDSEE